MAMLTLTGQCSQTLGKSVLLLCQQEYGAAKLL